MPPGHHAGMQPSLPTGPMEPLDLAVLDLVCSTPLTWTELAEVARTSTEEEALKLLLKAGLLEMRIGVRIRMDGQASELEMVVVASGNGTAKLLWLRVFEHAPHWFTPDRLARARCEMRTDGGLVRLSDQGELARHDILHPSEAGNAQVVLDIVLRRGMVQFRPKCAPKVRVESCRTSAAEAGSAANSTAAIANATASIGDIKINNVIQIDPEALAAAIAKVLKEGKDVAGGGAAEQGRTGSGSTAHASGESDRGAAPSAELKPCVLAAGAAYEWALKRHSHLERLSGKALVNAVFTSLLADAMEGYKLPKNRAAFARYLRWYHESSDPGNASTN